jgi:glyoxylase-like metal-dependent hydrolase (beta-lactamase superfamily II)
MIKIHHIDCASMCPVGSKIFPSLVPPRICCHCLLIETDSALVLVDAGLGTDDFSDPARRLGISRHGLGIENRPELPAIRQLPALGFNPADVQHIVLTHLDLDHAGGVSDFPHAKVHVLHDELKEARDPGPRSRLRYRPLQWSAHENWREHHSQSGEAWFGFEAVRDIPGLPPELLIIPLPGHSAGHLGVAVDGPNGWLFHVGDAFYHPNQLSGGGPRGLRWLSKAVDYDLPTAEHNRTRLAELMRERPELEVFCAHDTEALERLKG